MADPLSDHELEAVLDPSAPAADHPVGGFVDDARRALRGVEAPPVTGALAEFVGTDVAPTPAAPTPAAADATILVEPATTAPDGRRPVVALTGTVAGKFVLAGSAALAITGAAHVSGAIDVPGLPEVGTTVVEVATSAPHAAPTPPTTSPVDEERPSTDSISAAAAGSASVAAAGSSTTAAATEPVTIEIPDVGSLTVLAGATLSFVEADPAPGWSIVELSESRNLLEARFRNGDSVVEVEVELEDGVIDVRIRDVASGTETDQRYLPDGTALPSAAPVGDDGGGSDDTDEDERSDDDEDDTDDEDDDVDDDLDDDSDDTNDDDDSDETDDGDDDSDETDDDSDETDDSDDDSDETDDDSDDDDEGDEADD